MTVLGVVAWIGALLAGSAALGIAVTGPVRPGGALRTALWTSSALAGASLLAAGVMGGDRDPVTSAVLAVGLAALPLLARARRVAPATASLLAVLTGGYFGYAAATQAAAPVGPAAICASVVLLSATSAVAASVRAHAGTGPLAGTSRAGHGVRRPGWGFVLLVSTITLTLASAALSSTTRSPSRLLTASCLLAAASAVLSLRRPPAGGSPAGSMTLGRIAAIAAALAAIPVAYQQSINPAATRSSAGTPALIMASAAGFSAPVLIVPNRPGWNLVQVGTDDVSVGADSRHLVEAQDRPDLALSWATVELGAGRSVIWVQHSGEMASVTVDTGSAGTAVDPRGPDGPECADAGLGLALGRSTAPLLSCPADRLESKDAEALRALVRFLQEHGNHSASIVADSSPRGVRARAVVATEMARRGIRIGGGSRQPVLVVSGWARAAAAVKDVSSGRLKAEGTYLAPWLLQTDLLRPAAGQLLPLRTSPSGAQARAYLTALREWFPRSPAAMAGFRAWSTTAQQPAGGTSANRPGGGGTGAARPRQATEPEQLRLYASSVISLFGLTDSGDGAGAGHQHGPPQGWVPGGAVVPVTGTLDPG